MFFWTGLYAKKHKIFNFNNTKWNGIEFADCKQEITTFIDEEMKSPSYIQYPYSIFIFK